jgi:hypothetical protein
MTDIVEELRAASKHEFPETPHVSDLLSRAANTIESLRAVAGIATESLSFSDLKKEIRNG